MAEVFGDVECIPSERWCTESLTVTAKGLLFRVERLWSSDKDNLWPIWLLAHICSHLSAPRPPLKGEFTKSKSDDTYHRK